jgi:hypothetical protein
MEQMTMPPVVREVLESPGEPLDAATRGFMGSRFGHDFSKVRVHADDKASESARALNALAYMVGKDVVFGAGQYTPGTKEGQLLLTHELTHVLQQDTAATPLVQRQDVPGASQPAPATELPTSLDVTPGEFGKALGFRLRLDFDEKDAAQILARLQASGTFMSMAEDLDNRVVSFTGGHLGLANYPAPGEEPREVVDFIFTSGTSYFEPKQTGDNTSLISYLVIGMPSPAESKFTATEFDKIADDIVHETEHLVKFMGTRPVAASAAEAVKVGVQEERGVRGVEQTAVSEMAAAVPRPTSSSTSSRKTRDIERDLTGIGGYKTTYLESFALSFLREQAAEALSADERKAADALCIEFELDVLPVIPLSVVSEWDIFSMAVSTLMLTNKNQKVEVKKLAVNDQDIDYVTARVVLRFLDLRWRQNQPEPVDKENFLQENLKAFGAKAGVRYSL